MKKTDLVFGILGLVVSGTIGVVGLVNDWRKKRTLTEEDKEDIADRVVLKLGTNMTNELMS